MNDEGKKFLRDACPEARKWAKRYETLADAWDACVNPEWMFWALNKLGYSDDVTLRRFACWCARETPLADGRKIWDLLTDERSRRAVEVAEAFCDGKASAEDLAASRAAARAAASDAARAAASDAQAKALRSFVGQPFNRSGATK